MFGIDSKFYKIATWIYRIMLTNILFLVAALPIITLAPALAALVNTLKHTEDPHILKPFFRYFKKNLWSSLPLGFFNVFSGVFMMGLMQSNLSGSLTLKLLLVVFGLFLGMYNLNLYLTQMSFNYNGYFDLFRMTFVITLVTLYKLVWPLLLFAGLCYFLMPDFAVGFYLFLISGPMALYVQLYQRQIPLFATA